MSRIKDILYKPLMRHFPLCGMLFILSAFPYAWYYFTNNAYLSAGLFCLHSLSLSYLLVLSTEILPRLCLRVYQIFLFTIVFIFFTLDCFIVFEYGFEHRYDLIAIIQGTNLNEALEFLFSYFTWVTVIKIVVGGGFLCVLYYFLVKVGKFLKKSSQTLLLVIVCLGFVFTFIKPHVLHNNLFGQLRSFLVTSSVPDLREYFTHPQLIKVRKDQPDNIVLIVGESFAKKHSSMYGYKHQTNPLLSSLRDSSQLYVYTDVTSAAVNTVPSFQFMMSTFRKGMNNPYYECTTLLEIMHNAGYHIEWISNQNRYGLWDNVVTKYAELSDTCIFINAYANHGVVHHDGVLVDVVSERLKTEFKDLNKRMYIIHLMGSHQEFEKRYPIEFSQFRDEDYLDYPQHQRSVLASYDNSILYNDYVVYQLMTLFRNRDALVLYLSDHGLDIFETRPDVAWHADRRNPKSVEVGVQIPYMFYVSDKFRSLHPQLFKSIQANVHQSFCTEDLLYTLMDVAGVKFVDNDDVSLYSVFRK